jgi:OOP family OmpA-OmpF porin
VLSSRIEALESALEESDKRKAEETEKNQRDFEGLQGQISTINQELSKPSDNYNEFVTKLINDGFVNIYFDFNSTKIDKTSAGSVDFLITYLKNNPSRNIDLLGYADERGTEKYNLQLSENRAKALVDLLVEAGIERPRLRGEGKGEAKLTQREKSSPQAYQLSRRVSVEVR